MDGSNGNATAIYLRPEHFLVAEALPLAGRSLQGSGKLLERQCAGFFGKIETTFDANHSHVFYAMAHIVTLLAS